MPALCGRKEMNMTPLRITTIAALVAAFSAASLAVSPAAEETPRGNQGDRTTERSRPGAEQTPGWNMMTTQERDRFQRDLQSAKSPEQCRHVLDKHRHLMAERAKERGVSTPNEPRQDLCAGMSSSKPAP
jgi:hypothetical protein